jgi:hypothetical protein
LGCPDEAGEPHVCPFIYADAMPEPRRSAILTHVREGDIMKTLNYPHVVETNCPLLREDFAPDECCADGGLPDEHPTWAEKDEVARANSPFGPES